MQLFIQNNPTLNAVSQVEGWISAISNSFCTPLKQEINVRADTFSEIT